MKKVKLLNVPFDACTKEDALERILDCFYNRGHEGGKQIITPNPEMLLEASHNPHFLEALKGAWMSIPDGIGILWAATVQSISKGSSPGMRKLKALFALLTLIIYPPFCRKVFPERVTGVDLMKSICSVSRRTKTPIFLLGAQPGIAAKTKEVLEEKYPGITIVGTFPGTPFFDDFPRIQSLLAETRPEILFVAYGSPSQELWIARHLHELRSVKIAMGVGGAFDFIAGVHKRAPQWMQKLGLEWLYRLIQEPARIKRIWNATVRFPRHFLRS